MKFEEISPVFTGEIVIQRTWSDDGPAINDGRGGTIAHPEPRLR